LATLVRGFLRAPLRRKLRAAPIAVGLVLLELALTLSNFATARRWLGRIAARPSRRTYRPDTPGELADEIAAVARRRPLAVLGVDCVAESLLLESLLLRRSAEPELRIGVDPTDPSIAHTWVELGGVPLNDSADVHERFAAFDETIPRS